jgi:tetratricopeptide (TPR) repeat protein
MELRPDDPLPGNNLARAYLDLGRIDEAEAVVRSVQSRGVAHPFQAYLLYAIGFLRGDEGLMKEQLGRQIGLAAEMHAESDEARRALSGGRVGNAREHWRRSIQVALEFGFVEVAADFTGQAAVGEALLGHRDEARRLAREALELSSGVGPTLAAALALGLTGTHEEAETLLDALEAAHPDDTLLRERDVPVRRGVLALDRGEPRSAIETLRSAEPYEGLTLEAWWVRGEAHMAAGDGGAAIAELEKIIAHPGIDPVEPLHSLAWLSLGRAWTTAGDLEGAAAAYEEFLARWAQADPDLELYQRAQAEYESLAGRTRG